MTDANGSLLKGRVAVVTGATSGLGAAYARALAAAGAAVVVNGRRAENLHRLARELPRGTAIAGDVAEPRTADRLVEAAVEAYGGLDVLVNNAGTLSDRTLGKMTAAEFDDVLRSHVHGTFNVTSAAVPVMRVREFATVINVSSDSGLRGAFGQTNYAAAKGAIVGMTLTWARELARFGMTCNCILPNAVTAMTEGLDDLLAAYGYGPKGGPPRAIGDAEEAAPLVVALASERWAHVNGRLLGIGGDKLSVWEPAREVGWAFKPGGWSVADLHESIDLVAGGDPNGGSIEWKQPAVRPH